MTSPPPKDFVFPPKLTASLRRAAASTSHLSSTGLLNEESLTGALLGALTTALPCSLESDTPEWTEVFWIPYNTGTASNLWSEARIGADFSLLLMDHYGRARFAVFQAKRSAIKFRNERWYLDVRHLPGKGSGNTTTQLVSLAQTGQSLMDACATYDASKGPLGNFSWIHYVCYGTGQPSCIALSTMNDEVWKNESSLAGLKNEVEIFPDNPPTLFDVLADAHNPDSPHWTTLSTPESLRQIINWVDLLRVGVVVNNRGWRHLPSHYMELRNGYRDRVALTFYERVQQSRRPKL